MPNLHHHFSHSATIISVTDIAKSLAFYRDQLGFTISFTWQEPVSYAILRAGENTQIHLSQREADRPLSNTALRPVMYIFVHDIDDLYEAYTQRGVTIHNPIGDRDYQMRDFDILDPDGHIITFGVG